MVESPHQDQTIIEIHKKCLEAQRKFRSLKIKNIDLKIELGGIKDQLFMQLKRMNIANIPPEVLVKALEVLYDTQEDILYDAYPYQTEAWTEKQILNKVETECINRLVDFFNNSGLSLLTIKRENSKLGLEIVCVFDNENQGENDEIFYGFNISGVMRIHGEKKGDQKIFKLFLNTFEIIEFLKLADSQNKPQKIEISDEVDTLAI